MIHFSKDTLKNAKLVFQVKDQLKDVLAEYNFDEVDLLNFADEFTASFREQPAPDKHRDPGLTRDYRNYDVDQAFEHHQNEIFREEYLGVAEEVQPYFSVNKIIDQINPTWSY